MDTFENEMNEQPQQAEQAYIPPRKPSPFANSPYEMPHQAAGAGYAYTPPKEKKSGKAARRILVVCIVLTLLVGSCGLTGWLVNSYWEERTEDLVDQFNSRLEALEKAPSVSGPLITTPTDTVEGMLPSQVYEKCKNSVVAITCTGTGSFGTQSTSSGSGFILTEDGYIVSNHHVIEGGKTLKVVTYDGTEYEATLIGSDDTNDVALLKIEATGLQAVTLGSSTDARVGDMVVAIGNPLGELISTQTVGYISGKDREVTTDGTVINMLQTDAAINPGNSGGPLFNMLGQVVGITTAKYSGTTGSGASIEGVGFAIPIDDVTGMLDDLMNLGYVSGAYLGVHIVDLPENVGSIYGLPVGPQVKAVDEGSCAANGGIQVGDLILKLGDHDVSSTHELTRALRKFKAGDAVTMEVFRGGQRVKLNLVLDEKPHEAAPQETQPTETTKPSMPQDGSYDDWFDYFFGK